MGSSTARRPSLQWNCSSAVMKTAAILVSIQLFFALCSTDGGGSVVCSSAGERGQCLQSQSSRPGCAAGAEEDCTRNTGDPASLYNPDYVEGLSNYCSTSQTNDVFPARTVARGLTVILYPIGEEKKYSLYVSWQTTNMDSNTQGFYIWSYKCSGRCWSQNVTTFPTFDRDRYECLLIEDPNARSVLFNGAAHQSGILQCKDGKGDFREKCNSDHIMTVMVMPWPRSSAVTFPRLLATSSLTFAWENLWMDCWPTLYSASCSSPVVIQPAEYFNATVILEQDGGMTVHVTWPCTAGDVEYIVTITDPLINAVPNCTSPRSNPPCFVARNTTQVTIKGLDMSREYSISVQVLPKCNGSSFAQHYVGCRSEHCCQAKRIGPMGSGNSSSGLPATSVESSRVSIESSCISVKSSSVKSQSTSTNMQASVKSSSIGMETSNTIAPSVPVVSSTMAPPYDEQNETGRVGRTGAVVGVALAVVLVAFFVTSATVIISYFARRRFRAGVSLTSDSSLTESLETLEGGGGGEGSAGYCHLVSIGPTSSYSATMNGTRVSEAEVLGAESPEGTASQKTMEVGLIAGGSGEPTSDSEKISGVSMSLEDDAFESSSEGTNCGESDSGKESLTTANDGEVPPTCINGGVSTTTNDKLAPTNDELGPTKRSLKRTRSESVRTKTVRNDSSSSHRKRPRSLSSSQHPNNAPPPLSALILYSKATPEEEKRTIQQLLVSDLTKYNIQTVSEDTSTLRECPASWLEAQMREVSAVFCVCNEAFYREWYNQADRLTSLVPVFKQLCHGLVTPSYGENKQLLDKIAIVLSSEANVPPYLNSRRKFFLHTDSLPKMALFTRGLPEYRC